MCSHALSATFYSASPSAGTRRLHMQIDDVGELATEFSSPRALVCTAGANPNAPTPRSRAPSLSALHGPRNGSKIGTTLHVIPAILLMSCAHVPDITPSHAPASFGIDV
ncbi:hypothetical protein PHLGIDRAFT_247224 [Phlebiopsis gigantea 11061_1 CR5-6]|uniref:Uncharacterized protein n=1 Tax=Phlebiopsis gigantea (strain 11061_1 CR5-6) TaxID=745531 RepID=A0A0C3S4Y7_PHLG1|nr:hypothetical protein PHLGIDRAFT_247224 [Phlebiopsis gigantea 11061_1 CR5-6]